MNWALRNRWWLLALAVLVPATIVAALWPRWFEYQDRVAGPTRPVAIGDSVEYGGATFTLEQWSVVLSTSPEGEELDLPVGTQRVSTVVSVEPGEASPGCLAELVDPDGNRRWRDDFEPLPDLPGISDALANCDEEATGPYLVVFSFTVPDDLGGLGELELAVPDALPLRLRFLP